MRENPGRDAPLKVCYFLKRYPRLSETFIVNEIEALQRQGVDITIVAGKSAGEEMVHEKAQALKVPVYYMPKVKEIPRDAWSVKYLSTLSVTPAELGPDALCGPMSKEEYRILIEAAMIAPLLLNLGVDLIHAHFATWAATAASWVSKVTRIPYSFTAHAKDIYHESVDKRTLSEKMAMARFVVTVSDFNKEYLEECLKSEGRSGRIIRLYNGIDLDEFKPSQAEKEPDLLVGVGRLVEKKGFSYLIEACKLLEESGKSFKCVIIGEGDERKALVELVKKYGLKEKVLFLGAKTQTEVIRILKTASVFVLPCIIAEDGNRDGLPTVLLEAMALGVPVISTTVTGIPEIITHGKSGLLVPQRDPRLLAREIGEVLANQELQSLLQRGGRLKVEEVFDVKKNIFALKRIFSQAVIN
ncbi:MAG: glycosyltransferase family 4 protein [Nitrospira sp.]